MRYEISRARLFKTKGAQVIAHKPSLGLLESLGLKREGLKREAHFDGERYADIVVLGLLREEL